MVITPRGTVTGIELMDDNDPSFLENEAAMVEWEKKTVKRYETWKQERIRLKVHVFICMISQIFLLVLLFKEAKADFNLKATVLLNIEMSLLASKCICSIILHLIMS